ncbi:MAG TPA: cupin domain-containing protein [Gemmatimonadaceae bacterium]|nr:cupin domain-containing protein [Gemmatimonadaceae bacterium]
MDSNAFVRTTEVPWETTGPGVRRQILGHGPDLMMVRVEFEQGSIGPMHHHPHRQVTYVAAGRFETHVNGSTQVLGPGDCFYIAAELEHGVTALEAGTLIDVFTPAREDFLRATA